MSKVIGLDFGTTNSAIAVATADGTAQIGDLLLRRSADRNVSFGVVF